MQKYVLAIIFYPTLGLAEVSDKIPTQGFIWAFGIVTGILLFLLLRISKWFNLLAILVLVYFGALVHETTFSDISRHIRIEQGVLYSVTVYGAFCFFIVALLLGNYYGKSKK